MASGSRPVRRPSRVPPDPRPGAWSVTGRWATMVVVEATQPRDTRSDLSGRVTVRRTATTTELELIGEIDAAVVVDFHARYATPEPVDVIDTSGVTFLCVRGAELVVEFARVSAGAGRA